MLILQVSSLKYLTLQIELNDGRAVSRHLKLIKVRANLPRNRSQSSNIENWNDDGNENEEGPGAQARQGANAPEEEFKVPQGRA